jgi:hypothetical protein
MKLPRRRFLHLATVAAALPVISDIAIAQSWPSVVETLEAFHVAKLHPACRSRP